MNCPLSQSYPSPPLTSDPDVRRGLAFALEFSGALGKQLNHGVTNHLED
ncbi:DUF1641 domain-containing protein [Pseudomonas protegens]